MPATPQKPKLRTASLRAVSSGGLRIDEAAGVIYGVAIMSEGEARGHAFTITRQTLLDTCELINAEGGVKTRLTHPTGDGVGSLIGSVSNARIVGNVLRGDLRLAGYAEHLPGQGDVKTYLLKLAQEDPQNLGMSAVIDFQITAGPGSLPVARVIACEAVDVVERPAANRNGLLSIPNLKEQIMDPNLKAAILAKFNLPPETSDETAQAIFDAMSPDAQAECIAAPAKMSAGNSLDTVALAERRRVNSIRDMARLFPHIPQVEVDRVISASLSVGDARKALLAQISAHSKPIPGSVIVGDDRNRASLNAAVGDALSMKVKFAPAKPHERAVEFSGMPSVEIVRRYFESSGINMVGVGRATLARMAISENAMPQNVRRACLAQSTDSFPSVLANVFSSVLQRGYAEPYKSWPVFAKQGTQPDFKTGYRPLLSAIATPRLTPEGGEVTYSNLTDQKETITLAKYSGAVRLTWEAVVNDELDAFAKIIAELGRGASRVEEDTAYTPLLANAGLGQTMATDGLALFHASHSNYLTATADVGALSIATLNSARVKLGLQTGLAGETLNLMPGVLLVPTQLATTSEILTASMVSPGVNNSTPNAEFIRALAVVSNARLSAVSSTAWMLLAGKDQCDGVEVCFLEGETAPVLRSEIDFETEDRKWAIKHTVAARALDYRFAVRNAGA